MIYQLFQNPNFDYYWNSRGLPILYNNNSVLYIDKEKQ